jgi:hypothetical protein
VVRLARPPTGLGFVFSRKRENVLDVFSRLREKKGPVAKQRGDEGKSTDEIPLRSLTLPRLAARAPTLSPSGGGKALAQLFDLPVFEFDWRGPAENGYGDLEP